jgi:hypothetical protein
LGWGRGGRRREESETESVVRRRRRRRRRKRESEKGLVVRHWRRRKVPFSRQNHARMWGGRKGRELGGKD